jgi:hypothetical protein
MILFSCIFELDLYFYAAPIPAFQVLSIGRQQKLAIRTSVIPKSLDSNMFQLNEDKEARTPYPHNAIVVMSAEERDPLVMSDIEMIKTTGEEPICHLPHLIWYDLFDNIDTQEMG